jgi:hypothetical protein
MVNQITPVIPGPVTVVCFAHHPGAITTYLTASYTFTSAVSLQWEVRNGEHSARCGQAAS